MSSMGSAKKKINAKRNLPCGRPHPILANTKQAPAHLHKALVDQLNEYCMAKKLNRSEACENILKVIVEESHHFTAVDLLVRLQKRFPNIGKATLYRNLPVLVESEVLKEGPHDSNGQVLYELSGEDHHDHIVCLNCRQIFEFHDHAIEKRQNQISKDLGFAPRDHRHVIYAACDYFKNQSVKKT